MGDRVDFRFRTASPVSSPLAVDPGGQIYIATHEGYLHALGPDGRFLWSYTVNGALLHGVVADGDKGALLASSKGLVYSLRQDGVARWVFQLPVTPEGPLRIDERRAAHFLAGSYLYAVSSRAGVLWRAGFAAAPSGNDFYEALSGETWLTTADGALHAVRTPARRQQWALGKDFSAAVLLAVSAELAFVPFD